MRRPAHDIAGEFAVAQRRAIRGDDGDPLRMRPGDPQERGYESFVAESGRQFFTFLPSRKVICERTDLGWHAVFRSTPVLTA